VEGRIEPRPLPAQPLARGRRLDRVVIVPGAGPARVAGFRLLLAHVLPSFPDLPRTRVGRPAWPPGLAIPWILAVLAKKDGRILRGPPEGRPTRAATSRAGPGLAAMPLQWKWAR